MSGYFRGQEIDHGAFGVVYEARRLSDDWPCAIKRLQDNVTDQDRKRFVREVRKQAQLEHPNIVQIVDAFLDHQPPWFVMPFARTTLAKAIKCRAEISPIEIFSQVCAGVDHAHKHNIIHRDLKPQNVLVFGDAKTQNGEVYCVSDFGLCRQLDSSSTGLTSSNEALGTPAYMSPEQQRNAKSVDHRSDVYSLGKILFELLTGRLPTWNLDTNLLAGSMRGIIERCLDDDPQKRFQSVSELVNAIDSTRL